VDSKEALSVRAATSSEVLPFVLDAMRYDTGSGQCDAGQIIAQSDAYLVVQGQNPVAGLLMRRRGSEIYVVAAAGRANIDLSVAMHEIINQYKSDEITAVSFTTKRRGLVKKAQKLGYKIDGYILRKQA
jgi:hypothetical protein